MVYCIDAVGDDVFVVVTSVKIYSIPDAISCSLFHSSSYSTPRHMPENTISDFAEEYYQAAVNELFGCPTGSDFNVYV